MADGLIDLKLIAMSMVDNILGEYGLSIGSFDDIEVKDEKKFKKIVLDELKEPKEIKTSPNKFYYWSIHKHPYKIAKVLKDGTISDSQHTRDWTVQDVLYIQRNMKKVDTRDDFKKLCADVNKFNEKLTNTVIGRIMWNLENGYLDNAIEVYHNLQYSHKQLPLQNNPQKRKEMGYYQ